jgi:hypothetical protein
VALLHVGILAVFEGACVGLFTGVLEWYLIWLLRFFGGDFKGYFSHVDLHE